MKKKKIKFREICRDVSWQVGVPTEVVAKVIRTFFEFAWRNVSSGYNVSVPNLGTLSKKHVQSRLFRRNGVDLNIEAHDRPKVTFSVKIRNLLR